MNSPSQGPRDQPLPLRERASRIRRAPTRRRLIRAATQVAAARGYAGLSVAQIIECAGVSRSTYYEHFTDRDDCFLAALDQLGTELIDRLEAAEPSGGSGAGPLIEALCGYIGDDRVAGQVLFVESLAAGADALELRDRLQRHFAILLAAASQADPSLGQEGLALLDDLVGGLFRLFAMRLRHDSAGGVGALSPTELAAWVESYVGTLSISSPKSVATRAQPSGEPTQTYELYPLSAGRHRLTEAEVEMNQRARIYSAIARLSQDTGYARTSIAEITAAARVSRNAFYRLFRNKADSASRALELVSEQVIGACASAFTSGSIWPERVWRVGETIANFVSTAPDFAYLGLVETHMVGDETVQLIYSRLGAFALFLEEGYRWQPQARDLPRVSSDVIGATLYETAFRTLRDRSRPEGYAELLPQSVFICLAPFMGPKAATDFVLEMSEEREERGRRGGRAQIVRQKPEL